VVIKDLPASYDLRILDYNGEWAFRQLRLAELEGAMDREWVKASLA